MESLSAVLGKLDTIPEYKDRIAYIKGLPPRFKNPVAQLSYHLFNPNIKFHEIPEDFTYSPSLDPQEAVLYSEIRKLYLFTLTGNTALKERKRLDILHGILETMTPSDAELYLSVIKKKSPYRGWTIHLVRKALPELGL